MQAHCVFVLLSAVFATQMNWSYGAEDQAECKNSNNLRVLNRCCNTPTTKKIMTEEEGAVNKMCFKIYGDGAASSTNEEKIKLSECMSECFFNATQKLTADMKLNETAFIAEFDFMIENSPHWKEVIVKTVKTCIEKNEVKPEAKCKSGSYQFLSCFLVNLYLNCPQENWKTEDEECNNVREILKKC